MALEVNTPMATEVMRVVSFKLPSFLDRRLSELAKARRTSRSALLREAVESLSRPTKRSAGSLAGDLVGSVRGPRDLATNPKHLRGYGR